MNRNAKSLQAKAKLHDVRPAGRGQFIVTSGTSGKEYGEKMNLFNGGYSMPDDHTDPDVLSLELSPEQQIDNVLHALDKLVNGPSHRYRMDAIRSTTKQLAEMWQKYQTGELEPVTDELPF